MQKAALSLFRSLPLSVLFQESMLFYLKLGYWPDFRNPQTFNEKLNYRKLFSTDERFTTCSDKLEVRDWVGERIGTEYLIPLLYSGERITAEQLLGLGDNIVAKASHDYKSAQLIRRNSLEISTMAVKRLELTLRINFVLETNQVWYAKIKPMILVERLLMDGARQSPNDYKILCFRRSDGSVKKLIEVHENRGTPEYVISMYTENREPVRLRGNGEHRRAIRPFPCPEHWDHLLRIADTLGREFDHVRVDLYCVQERVYFGELTFCDSGGRSPYTREDGVPNDMDLELGGYWHLAR